MKTIRRFTMVVTAIAVFAVLIGHAAGITGASSSLAAGAASVSRCDTDGVTVYQNITGANVIGVWVWGIASTCTGGTISVTVNNGSSNSLGSATVPANGFAIATLAVPVLAKEVEQIDVSITGP